jgi:hypothetical protein
VPRNARRWFRTRPMREKKPGFFPSCAGWEVELLPAL